VAAVINRTFRRLSLIVSLGNLDASQTPGSDTPQPVGLLGQELAKMPSLVGMARSRPPGTTTMIWRA
jgi:hypothetical protein